MKYICGMKLARIILSFYIIALSFDKCNDNSYVVANEFSVVSAQNSHSNNIDCYCSPFCHCNCCGKPIIPALSVILCPPSSVYTYIDFIYKNQSTRESLHYVWRPPVNIT